MGTRRECDAPILPARPVEILCISNAQGVGQCYNPVTGKIEVRSMNNYVCKDIVDHNRQEDWIEAVLKAASHE